MTHPAFPDEIIDISEDRFRTLFNNLPIACYGYDLEGNIQIWNKAYEDLYGFKAKDIVGHSLLRNIKRSIERKNRREIIHAVYAGRSFYGLQWRDRRANGTACVLLVDTFPLRDAGGRITLGICLCIDVTKQRRTQKALLHAAQEWRDTFDAMADSVSIIDTECTIQRTNKATGEMFGLHFRDLVGKKCYELFHGSKGQIQNCPFQRMLTHRKSESEEFYLDTLKQWVSITVNPIIGARDRIIGSVHVVRNITDWKLAEEALKESELHYRTTIDSMGDAIHVVDHQLRITLFNKVFRKWVTNLELDTDAIGRTIFEVFPFLDDSVTDEYNRVFQTKKTLITEEKTKIGSREFMTETRKIPIIEHGHVTHVVTIIRDITERKQLHEKLLQSEKMSALGQLIAGVAHELNNPMAGVLGYSQLLLLSSRLSETFRQNLERIHQEAERARKIVQNLLTFARQRKPEKKKVTINEIVKSTLNLRAYEMQVNNIELVTEFDKNIPWLLADEHQLQQVFMNIILNAEQAMLEANGKGRLNVTTHWDADREVVQITFHDNGPGIAEEHFSRVFDPFFTTKPNGEGTGLGLSISYGIVQEHDGRITAESQKGHGATFTIELPRTEEVTSMTVLPSSESNERVDVQGKRILVIDDESSLVELVEMALEREGCTVETATDGDMAMRSIDTGQFDAVVSDLKMPGKSGIDIFLHCKEKKPELAKRFLFLTGDVVTPDSMRFIKEQHVPYISKPFDLEDLASSVAHLFH